jgi:hypothetical protein
MKMIVPTFILPISSSTSPWNQSHCGWLQRAKQRGITAKVKKETANLKHLRKTYRALKRWYKDTR